MFSIINPVINQIIGENPSIDMFTFPVLEIVLTNFISIALGAAGIVAFFFLLAGGLEYITAGGDKERTQNSVKKISNALIGLAIVLSIFAIIYVVETIFGISITKFTIPVIR